MNIPSTYRHCPNCISLCLFCFDLTQRGWYHHDHLFRICEVLVRFLSKCDLRHKRDTCWDQISFHWDNYQRFLWLWLNQVRFSKSRFSFSVQKNVLLNVSHNPHCRCVVFHSISENKVKKIRKDGREGKGRGVKFTFNGAFKECQSEPLSKEIFVFLKEESLSFKLCFYCFSSSF